MMSIIECGQEEHGGKKDFPGEMNTRWGMEGRVGSWQAGAGSCMEEMTWLKLRASR